MRYAIIVPVIAALLMGACGGSDDGSLKVVVERSGFISGGVVQPPAGMKWAVLEIAITNTSSEPQRFEGCRIQLLDPSDRPYTRYALYDASEGVTGTISPKGTLRGREAYAVPLSESAIRWRLGACV